MRVMIDFDHWTEGDTLHRIRNLGEELYVTFKDSDAARIDINEVDRATNQLRLEIFHERDVDAVMARVEKLIREHFFTATARVRRE